jgi:hypothetical protein
MPGKNSRYLRKPMTQAELGITPDQPVNRPHISEIWGSSSSNGRELSWAHVAMQKCEDFAPSPPSEPCDDFPGSLKRIETYQRRVANGESLWHENDRNARV